MLGQGSHIEQNFAGARLRAFDEAATVEQVEGMKAHPGQLGRLRHGCHLDRLARDRAEGAVCREAQNLVAVRIVGRGLPRL